MINKKTIYQICEDALEDTKFTLPKLVNNLEQHEDVINYVLGYYIGAFLKMLKENE